MIRLTVFVLGLAAVAGVAAWLSLNPGRVTLYWLGWRIDTSAAFLMFIIALSALACALLASLVAALLRLPLGWKQRQQKRNYALGLSAVTHSLAALAGGQVPVARKELKNVKKYLGEAPITLLLTAQISKLEGKDADTRLALEAMLRHKETRLIAAKGLSEYHHRREQAEHALPHARRAFTLNPRDADALRTLISLYARLGQWQEAEQTLKRSSLAVNRAERRRLHAITYYARAEALKAAHEYEAAFAFASMASKQLPDFVPAAALAAWLANAGARKETAVRILQQEWKRTPHAQLARELLAVLKDAPAAEQWKTVQRVVKSNPDHEESLLLKAETAIGGRLWDEARRALKAALNLRESGRACRLMAELETAQYQDSEATARWSIRASSAGAEPEWTCHTCSYSEAEWHTHCPRCHSFDTMEWKQRSLRYAAA